METEIPEGYHQTEIGIIPQEWKCQRLSTITSIPIQNGVFNDPAKKGRGCKLINVGDLYSFLPIDSKSLELFDASKDELTKFAVANGDIFFTRSSLTPGGIAHCNIYYKQEQNEDIVFDCHIIRVRANTNKVDPFFLWRYCTASLARKYLVAHAKTTTMTTIDQVVIANLQILVPPLPEQKAIAQALSDADAAIAELDRLITKKRNIKQGTMTQLLTGKKRLPGFSDKWKLEELDNISSEIGDGIHATPEYLEYSEFYFINGNNLIDGSIKITEKTKCVSEEEYRKYKLALSNRTILLSINGTIGNIAFFNYEKVILGKSAAYINVKNFISKQYIFYFMQTHLVNCYLEDELTGSTIRNLSLKSIRNTPISLPQSIEEQEAIAQVLIDMDAEIKALEQKRDKYKAIKQGMMQELLTGRTRLV